MSIAVARGWHYTSARPTYPAMAILPPMVGPRAALRDLAAFMRHPGQVLSREQLLQMVWDLDFDPGSNVVDVHVAAVRRKVGAEVIETVRGMGYRFVVPRDAESASGDGS